MKTRSLKAYSFEFLLIFVAVISAFVLNTWNENRKSKNAEEKILSEIYRGLEKDSIDIQTNKKGHEIAVRATTYFNDLIDGKNRNHSDSLFYYWLFLTRDVIFVQNTSGYDALKSKGLETIENDSLRAQLLTLYEFDYQRNKKFEEQFPENQYYPNYFKEINTLLSSNFIYDSVQNLKGISLPLVLNSTDKQLLRSYLWQIKLNRTIRAKECKKLNLKVSKLRENIKDYLPR